MKTTKINLFEEEAIQAMLERETNPDEHMTEMQELRYFEEMAYE